MNRIENLHTMGYFIMKIGTHPPVDELVSIKGHAVKLLRPGR